MSEALFEGIVELREKQAATAVEQELARGVDAEEILGRCADAMSRVGELFEEGEYHLSELVYTSTIFKRIVGRIEAVSPATSSPKAPRRGTVVVGTVQGDVHDLGKNIVCMLLQNAGYDVHDLGVDVPPEGFVERVKETGARMVGMSGLLTTSFAGMKRVVQLLDEAGLRGSTRVMIGGGVINDQSAGYVGADLASRNAFQAVRFCNESGSEATL